MSHATVFLISFPCILFCINLIYFPLLSVAFALRSFCVCFALLAGEESCHMLRFTLMVLLWFVCGKGAVTCYGLLCFAWLWFVLLVRWEICHALLFVLHCFASVLFALLCFALHCISKPRACYEANQKQAKNMLNAY